MHDIVRRYEQRALADTRELFDIAMLVNACDSGCDPAVWIGRFYTLRMGYPMRYSTTSQARERGDLSLLEIGDII